MQKLVIFGQKSSKVILMFLAQRTSLPILAASLLSTKGLFENLPEVKDIETMINLLKSLGSSIKNDKDKLIIDNSKQNKNFASYNLVKTMAGILFWTIIG